MEYFSKQSSDSNKKFSFERSIVHQHRNQTCIIKVTLKNKKEYYTNEEYIIIKWWKIEPTKSSRCSQNFQKFS